MKRFRVQSEIKRFIYKKHLSKIGSKDQNKKKNPISRYFVCSKLVEKNNDSLLLDSEDFG